MNTTWKEFIGHELTQPYMRELKKFLLSEKMAGKVIFPHDDNIFSAFNLTPFDQVKVVILGQDPYHGPNQAHGLCFSVKPGIPPPPSLMNIFKEIKSDLGITQPGHGCLVSWAKQGILLLNAVLTVEKGRPASHQGKGWEKLTDVAVSLLNEKKEGLVFLLWGNYAQKKGGFIDTRKHLVLKSPHPSPFSASNGFFGNRHFSKTNKYLKEQGKETIDWLLPPVK
jgi:uracil-DNA glycosylase